MEQGTQVIVLGSYYQKDLPIDELLKAKGVRIGFVMKETDFQSHLCRFWANKGTWQNNIPLLMPTGHSQRVPNDFLIQYDSVDQYYVGQAIQEIERRCALDAEPIFRKDSKPKRVEYIQTKNFLTEVDENGEPK